MELLIEGNKAPFQITRQITPLQLRLEGQYNASMTLYYDNAILSFDNGALFFQFGQRIKGASVSSICAALAEFQVATNPQFIVEFSRKSFTEVNLFKSVFLIYSWVEIAYTDAYAVDLSSKIYNEFIIDFNNSPGPQEEIYFIPKDLISNDNQPLLKRLININLLVSALFSGGNLGQYQAYFLPLEKPGVLRDNFMHEHDPSGERTYNLWKRILRNRDDRISSWMKNRY